MWGPVRHGPGHNVATYHRNPEEQTIELFIELDLMKDEELGYFDPRPWHRDTPQRPKRLAAGHHDGLGTVARGRFPQADGVIAAQFPRLC